MIAMSIALVVVTLLLFVMTGGFLSVRQELQDAERVEHAKCMAMVAAFVGDKFAADVLRAAAADWESIEGQAAVRELARVHFHQDGPSVPALWMVDRANHLMGFDSANPADWFKDVGA